MIYKYFFHTYTQAHNHNKMLFAFVLVLLFALPFWLSEIFSEHTANRRHHNRIPRSARISSTQQNQPATTHPEDTHRRLMATMGARNLGRIINGNGILYFWCNPEQAKGGDFYNKLFTRKELHEVYPHMLVVFLQFFQGCGTLDDIDKRMTNLDHSENSEKIIATLYDFQRLITLRHQILSDLFNENFYKTESYNTEHHSVDAFIAELTIA